LIRYHCWWPSVSDPYYQFNITENRARVNYYGADYTPHLHLDGTVDGGYNSSGWNSLIRTRLNVSSPLDISITGEYDPITRQGSITATVLATAPVNYSNLKLRIAIVESDIGWQAPNGTFWHNQTFRDMLPSTAGVSLTIAEGETFSYDQAFTLNSQLVDDNCEIVVFVQSDNGRQILQGAKESITMLPSVNTLQPFSLLQPPDGSLLYTCYPEFIWQSTSDPGSGNDINYVVHVATDPSFTNPLVSPSILDTSWVSETCLIPDVPYYWRVLASNGAAPDRFSEEVFNFTVAPTPDCDYVIGDFNGSGTFNIADIVDSYSMLKTGAPDPALLCECPAGSGDEWAVAMDVNGSCAFNIADIITAYSKLKTGSPVLIPCQYCPPGG